MAYLKVKDSQGKWHLLATQEKNYSCAIACTAMVIARVRGIQLPESDLRKFSQALDHTMLGVPESRGYTPGYGTEVENIAMMLRKVCVPTEAGKVVDVKPLFAKATPLKPVLAHVRWDGGGAHYVVVDGLYDAIRAVVCDPWPKHGLREVNNLPLYNPGGKSPGQFTGWVAVVK